MLGSPPKEQILAHIQHGSCDCYSLYSSYRVIIKVGYSLIRNNQIGHQRQMCKSERGCDRSDSCAFKHAGRALQKQQEAGKARKAQKSKSADEVPNTGFQGLPVPKSKVRFNMTLVRRTQVSLCDQHRVPLASALRD